jgi:hypothetical protein
MLKWATDNNVNFKPAEMLFNLHEFRNAMNVRQAKPLLQVHQMRPHLAHINN